MSQNYNRLQPHEYDDFVVEAEIEKQQLLSNEVII